MKYKFSLPCFSFSTQIILEADIDSDNGLFGFDNLVFGTDKKCIPRWVVDHFKVDIDTYICSYNIFSDGIGFPGINLKKATPLIPAKLLALLLEVISFQGKQYI